MREVQGSADPGRPPHLVVRPAGGSSFDDPPVDPDVSLTGRSGSAAKRHAGRGGVLRDRWDIVLVIAVGGALGSVGRWGLGEVLPHSERGIPWATMVENLSGGFALGVLMVFVIDLWPTTRYVRPFIGVGVLGGYTTFSTYMLDARTLIAGGQVPLAATYAFGTLIVGLLAVWAGISLARLVAVLARRRRPRIRERRKSDPERSGTQSETHPRESRRKP